MPFLLIVLSLVSGTFVCAIPPLPTEYYGTVKYYNMNGTVGSTITVKDGSNVTCGEFAIVTAGYYGTLSCHGNLPETATIDEGASEGESLIFLYSGAPASVIGDPSFTSGSFKRVDIIVPQLVCGDYFCDTLENSQTCPLDCGAPTNETPGGGPEGGEGTGEGGSGSGGGGGAGGALSTIPPQGSAAKRTCDENWLCSEWSECLVSSVQVRNCTDTNTCGTSKNTPVLSQDCVYVPTCFDGVKNGLETGVDCGGPCPACVHCFDGIQNFGELAVDCGGPCPSCPSCFDGVRNQGEQGIDCGGPCEACRKFFEVPRLVCLRIIDPFNPYFLFFVVLLSLVIFGRIVYMEVRVRRIMKDEDIELVKKTAMAMAMKRRTYLFMISTLLIALILFLYYYFIGICYEINLTYIWLLVIALLLVPLLVHAIMKRYEFDEKRLIHNMRMLHDTHYAHITDMVRIQTEHILELENDVAEMIRRLQADFDFRRIRDSFPEIDVIYKELLVLVERYKTTQMPFREERDLLTSISRLMGKEDFMTMAEIEPKLKIIADKLRVIFENYKIKQESYDALDDLDHSGRKDAEGQRPADTSSRDEAKGAGGPAHDGKEKSTEDLSGDSAPPEGKNSEGSPPP